MQYLTIQVDADRCRMLLVEGNGSAKGRVLVASELAVESDTHAQAESIRALAPMLKRGVPCALIYGGADLRVRQISVPPVPEEELPEIVRMQVERLAAAEGLAVDYIPPSQSEGQQSLLAAWCDESDLEHWSETIEQLGLRLGFIAPRALCGTSIAPARQDRCLVAVGANSQIDFVLYESAKPLLTRSTPLADGPQSAERELRRTLLACNDGASDTAVDRVLHDGILPTDTDSIDVQVEHFDLVAKSRMLLQETEQQIEASELGALEWLINDQKPAIDFANPHGSEVADRSARPRIAILVATACTLLAFAWMAYTYLDNLQAKLDETKQRIEMAEEDTEKFAPYAKRLAQLEAWQATDITWLDELERISRKVRPLRLDAKEFVASSDLRTTQLLGTSYVGSNESGGTIVLSARSKSASTQDLENRLRDKWHEVEPQSTAEVLSDDGYNYRYIATIHVPAEIDSPSDSQVESNPESATDSEEREEKPATEPSKSEDSA